MQVFRNSKLSVFHLVMINVIAISSLRTIPIGAQFGLSIVFFSLLAGVTFLIPCALVAAELSTSWPLEGGLYIWVREAFGRRWGFVIAWIQWIYNICWYPTILSVLGAGVSYLFFPKLASNKYFLLSMVLLSYWIISFINHLGIIRILRVLSTFSALLGTILPTVLLVGFGLVWFFRSYPTATNLSWSALAPDFSFTHLSFFTGIIYGLVGIEMSAIHARDVSKPQLQYPLALFYSTILVLFILIFASLAVAIITPKSELHLISGLLQTMDIFLRKVHFAALMPLMALMVVCGIVGSVNAWLIGPSRALLVSIRDGCGPRFLLKCNKNQVPTRILLFQGAIFTVMSLIYLVFPSGDNAFWLLSVLTAQLSLICYLFMFAAGVKLRWRYPDYRRPYRVPGGKFGFHVIAGLGFITSLVVISFGFIIPAKFIGNSHFYVEFLIIGLLFFLLMPFLIYHFYQTRGNVESSQPISLE